MVDIFGAQYKQQITLDEKVQKSFLGGITSLIVIAASLAYFFYIINEWVNNNILPKSTSNMKVQNYSEIFFEEEALFEFSYWKYKSDQVDPFRQDRNILTPIGIYFIDGIPQQPFSLIKDQFSLSSYNTSIISVDKLKLIQNSAFNKNLTPTTELMIVITQCNQSLLNQGSQCAPDEEIEQFFESSVNFISFMLYLRQYNPYSQKFEAVQKQYYLTFDKNIGHQGQLMLTQTVATIDTGILFGKFEKQTYINDAKLITSATSTTYWKTLITQRSILNLLIRLDPMSFDNQIVYPKLGEILAQVGSIVSMLMIVQYLIVFYNEWILENDLINKVLNFYYLDYEQIKQSKEKQDQQTCKELIQQAKKKLVYTNIIYELSRIQLFLLHHFGRTELQQTHKYGLHCKNINTKNCCEAYDNLISNLQNHQKFQDFEKADFSILCKAKSKTIVQEKSSGLVFQEIKSSSLKSVGQ